MSDIRTISGAAAMCNENWVDASSVDLGCLLFDTSAKSYAEATKFCEDMDSSLIEIETPAQMEFITKELRTFSESAGWVILYFEPLDLRDGV